MLKISVILRVRSTSEIVSIFNISDEIFLVFTRKSKYSCYFFSVKGKNQLFAWLSAFSGYNIACKHSLHLDNGI